MANKKQYEPTKEELLELGFNLKSLCYSIKINNWLINTWIDEGDYFMCNWFLFMETAPGVITGDLINIGSKEELIKLINILRYEKL